MKKGTLSLLFSILCVICLAQTTITKYSRSQRFDDEVQAEKAKFSRTIVTDEDGSITTTDRNIKKNEIIGRYAHRGDEQVGVWITQRWSGGYEEVDFDFKLIYDDNPCANDGVSEKINKFFEDDPAINYVAPTFGEYENFYTFIGRNLRYPAKARREGIEGAVYLRFTITEDGNILDVVVTKGVHVVLDKEAARVLRKLKLNNPPKVNGQPRAICVQVPIKFKLA